MTARAIQARAGRERMQVTPEGIALPAVLASRGTRFGALLIDLVIMGVAMGVTSVVLLIAAAGLNTATGGKIDNPDPQLKIALEFVIILWIAAMFLFRYGYFLFFELGPRGATPGKRMTGIRIAARDGGQPPAICCATSNCSCRWFS